MAFKDNVGPTNNGKLTDQYVKSAQYMHDEGERIRNSKKSSEDLYFQANKSYKGQGSMYKK